MNTEPISRFMNRVKVAAQSGSKDVRISVTDAQELTAAIGELLAERVKQLEAAPKANETITISVDGGGFKK